MNNQEQIIEIFAEIKKKYKINLIDPSHIRGGKEAEVYRVRNSETKEFYALKLYKDNKNYSYNLYNPYIENVRINPKYGKMIRSRTYRGRKYMSQLRTLREFKVMERNYHTNFDQLAGIPKPIAVAENSILMDFIGQDGNPAPRLDNIKLNENQNIEVCQKIFNTIEYFLKNGIIHSDLSSFNILWHLGNPWIIDFPQAIDMNVNPNWKDFLKRDINNVSNYFDKKVKLKDFDSYSFLIKILNT